MNEKNIKAKFMKFFRPYLFWAMRSLHIFILIFPEIGQKTKYYLPSKLAMGELFEILALAF
jgi:hypothetical protein